MEETRDPRPMVPSPFNRWLMILSILLVSGARLPASSEVPDDEAMKAAIAPTYFQLYEMKDFFHGMDVVSVPAPGAATLPDPLLDKKERAAQRELVDVVSTYNEILGRNTWMLWCGGNEGFWDWLANHSLGFMDMLKLLDSRKRSTRWRDAGMVNEPGMKQAASTNSDPYGLWIDVPDEAYVPKGDVPPERIYGRSSGVVGLRLFKNPNFDKQAQKHWNPVRYYEDPSYFSDPNLVRPYRVGMSCAFCHASAHPLNPPQDPENPRWENISGSIGSQYLRIRSVFGGLLTEDSFVYHLLDSQPPGTIDTSLIASDNINNPNTMNAIFGVPQRVMRSFHNPSELLSSATAELPSLWENPANAPEAYRRLIPGLPGSNSNPRYVPRILFDGADSIGVYGALARVYLNIGTFYEQWIRLHEPLVGFLPPKAAAPDQRHLTQLPFKIQDCQEHSVYWQATQLRVEPLRDYFLKITPTMPLLDARGGPPPESRINSSKLAHGRQVFARNCIPCHSSIQPESNPVQFLASEEIGAYLAQHGALIGDRTNRLNAWASAGEYWDHDPGPWLRDERYLKWAFEVIEKPGFWSQNFLSTDYRVPVNYVKTNPGRALANNATRGHMWEDFSSESYKQMPAVGTIEYFNPFKGTNDFFRPRHKVAEGVPLEGGGPGFYRPPSLMGLWATAPYLHNNSLGLFNNDPSVNGRLAAFEDGIRKLLWPERRLESSSYNNATADRLRRDHGLIWRTQHETYLVIPGRHVPAFAKRLPWPESIHWIAERLGRLGRWRALPSVILFGAAFLLLANWGGRSRVGQFQRLGAYALIVSALGVGFLAYFQSGGFGDLRLGPIPAGTPVNLLANLNPDAPRDKLKKAFSITIEGLTEIETRKLEGEERARIFRERIAPALLEVSKCPDFVMDKGHAYPWFEDMTNADKEALIELLKTF